MNFKGKRIDFFCLHHTGKKIKRLMEYHQINGIDYGFYENTAAKVYHVIHLKTGLSVFELGADEYDKQTAFAEFQKFLSTFSSEKMEQRIKDTKCMFGVLDYVSNLND